MTSSIRSISCMVKRGADERVLLRPLAVLDVRSGDDHAVGQADSTAER